MNKLWGIILLLFSFNLSSQILLESINLNDYKLTDFKYRKLDLFFDLRGNSNYFAKNNFFGEEERFSALHQLNFRLNYNINKNSRKKQLSRSINFNTNPRYSFLEKNSKTESRVGNNSNFNFRQDCRRYLSSKLFFENDLKIYLNHNLGSRSNGPEFNNQRVSVSLPLLLGIGRIENISSAWDAFKIVRDLNESGLLSEGANISKDDIFIIADYITKRRYTRAFDFRRKLQDDIIGLSEQHMKKIVNVNNPRVYASIYDIWNYGGNELRRSGAAFSFGLDPEVFYLNDRSDFDIDVLKLNLFAMTKFEYYRALGMKWQFDFELDIKAGIGSYYNFGYEEFKSPFFDFKSDLNIGIGYYPTTRTFFRSSIFLNIGAIGSDEPIDANFYSNFAFRNSLYYYISPKLRLKFYLNLRSHVNVEYNDEYGGINGNGDYGISFNYYIF